MSLECYIKDALPFGHEFEIINLQSIPRETSPITFPKREAEDVNGKTVKTIKTQHFVALCFEEKVVFALEIVVYFSLNSANNGPVERLLFVSKADTNGYCDLRLDIGQITKSIIAYILAISPGHYLRAVKPLIRKALSGAKIIKRSTSVQRALEILSNRPLDSKGITSRVKIPDQDLYVSFPVPTEIVTKVSLFTRAEPQYLFSNSSKNPRKHVLSGDKLLKWWLKIVDQIVVEDFDNKTKATLQIPGEEKRVISNYLRNTAYQNWTVGDIFSESPQDIALYRIPLFPDDPKGRFLDHLISDGRISKVNVLTFWTELQARQEFRLGSTVSVIGVSGKYIGRCNEPERTDIIIPTSKKNFKNLKNYITGEEYDTEEGAEEAYMNIRDIFDMHYSTKMIKVIGNHHKIATTKRPEINTINVINTLSVHRKPKS
ncbi:H3 histone acetyltransferase RTT109 [Kluyveromyces lactis]|uniref:histone acetyltransferase n=1 Tax=Kluyveromyces lactis (strain ATCC 8585 / CBS 2359 / DSM 70799 / NBRC 1267 / NRRL Y-1140 / WM37) TaxID=284590 RepID=Q6CK78_KLULA|nr:uncharacterized protein KLLA0_F12914g [Kluyveromyces lactis]CAG98369.1 KLLA0F12914p [Kluyveromyces lactis]|eukprot:XP_455661.1 uncharacterized protein KLLA0_F12914g [Kluyveromyces lactis]